MVIDELMASSQPLNPFVKVDQRAPSVMLRIPAWGGATGLVPTARQHGLEENQVAISGAMKISF